MESHLIQFDTLFSSLIKTWSKEPFPRRHSLPSSDKILTTGSAHRTVDYLENVIGQYKYPITKEVMRSTNTRCASPPKFWLLWALGSSVGVQDTICFLTTDKCELDLRSVLYDRLALSYFLLNEPLIAARTAIQALELGDVEFGEYGVECICDSRIQAMIGWLLFDGGKRAESAEYLQLAYEGAPRNFDGQFSGVGKLVVELNEWYMIGGSIEGDYHHAITEIGDYWNFLPSGTMDRGMDAFLFRLAASLSAAGRYEQALQYARYGVALPSTSENDLGAWAECYCFSGGIYADAENDGLNELGLLNAALQVQLQAAVERFLIPPSGSAFRSERICLAAVQWLDRQTGSSIDRMKRRHTDLEAILTYCRSVHRGILDGEWIERPPDPNQTRQIADRIVDNFPRMMEITND